MNYLLDEIHTTLSEGIDDAIGDGADNLQFSRHLLHLPEAYNQELETIEEELRGLESRIQQLLIAMQQAAVSDSTSGMNRNQSEESLWIPKAWQHSGTENQAA